MWFRKKEESVKEAPEFLENPEILDEPVVTDLGKIVRVTLEYEQGTETLEGEDAEKWQSWLNGLCVLGYTHGCIKPHINYKVEIKS